VAYGFLKGGLAWSANRSHALVSKPLVDAVLKLAAKPDNIGVVPGVLGAGGAMIDDHWEDFQPFVRARWAALLRFGTVLTGDPNSAADLVQDALERTGSRWSSVRQKQDPEGYVRRTMVNRHVSRWRRERREVLVEEPAERPATPDSGDLSSLVWDVLATLPAKQRAVLVLRYYEDLSEAEIAVVLGCSTGTVKSQAAKAKEKVRLAMIARQEETWTR
jgi:RNA polymerase sigma-70 factor (sigma-E family)